MTPTPFSAISVLRIYMTRGDTRKAQTWWERVFERPLSTCLVEAALQAGVAYAAVTMGHVGFTSDAKTVSYGVSETPPARLPVCVELVAPRPVLEQFIRAQARHLGDATLVMVDGVRVASLLFAET
jgi:PII-like signaling protein